MRSQTAARSIAPMGSAGADNAVRCLNRAYLVRSGDSALQIGQVRVVQALVQIDEFARSIDVTVGHRVQHRAIDSGGFRHRVARHV